MSNSDDRLLSEKELKELIKDRCGLDGVKFLEIIRDCPTANALPIEYGDKDNGRTHNTGIEDTPGVAP